LIATPTGANTLSITTQTATPATVTFTPAANYNGVVVLRLTTNDPDGAGPCVGSTSDVTVTVNAKPAFTTTPVNATCHGDSNGSITINTTAGLAPFTYSIDNGSSFATTNPNTGLAAATYQVIVKDNNMCLSNTSMITINQPSLIVTPTVSSPINYCVNQAAAQLSATALGTGTLQWYTVATGGTAVTTAPTPVTTTTSVQNYWVSEKLGTCEGPRSQIVVNVASNPTLVINDPAVACTPGTVDITAAAVTLGSASGLTFSYHDTPFVGGMLTGTASSLSTSGVKYIVGMAAGGCYSISAVNVTVNPALSSVNAGNDQGICSGAALTLTAATSATGVNYSWTAVGSPTVLSTSAAASVTPTATTTYKVVISSSPTCTATDEVVIDVNVPTVSVNSVTNLTIGCTEGPWSYYTGGASDPSIYFAIDWGTNSSTISNAATVNISTNSAPWQQTSATNGSFLLPRYWDVDLHGNTLTAPVNVRFLYLPSDLSTLTNVATTFAGTLATPTITGIKWFKTNNGVTFDPTAHNTPTGLLNSYELTDATGGVGSWNGQYYAQFNGLTGFSGGTAAVGVNNTSILPVTLSEFKGRKIGQQVELKWKTASEINSKSFIVEKSTDGINYKTLAIVEAKGGSNKAQSYTQLDPNPASGDNYYRLIALDKDGISRYVGSVVSVNVFNEQSISVYPNPTSSDLTVNINTDEEMQTKIRVLDMNAKVIREFDYELLKGKNVQTLDINNLPAGTYMLQIENDNHEQLTMRRFVKLSK
jgi:hypothetical protein